MGRTGRVAVLAAVVIAGACKPKTSTEVSDAGPTASATSVVSVSLAAPPPQLPPDPPPRIPEKASEAPGLEADLMADKAYLQVWDDKHREDRVALLTAVSQALVTEIFGSENVSIPESLAQVLDRKKLTNAVVKIVSFFPRTGRFPEHFTTHVDSFLSSIASEPRLGVWSPSKPPASPSDFAALAYWLHPRNVGYLREFLAAKKQGPIKWENFKNPARPYFVRERVALERLAMLTALTPEETEQLARLRRSKLGDEPAEVVELAALLKEYGSNEVRADEKFKGKVIQFDGIAGALERGAIGGITLAMGTGRSFERPQVHCFFDDDQTERVKALNKGDRVRVRGKVDGLMMNVLVRHCQVDD